MSNKYRQLSILATVAICLFYLTYRALFTLNLDSPFAACFSIMLYGAELYGNILMFLYFFQIWNLDTPKPVPPLRDVTVDVMIPTYNEELELLRGTIEASLAMDYPHTVHVLDDGDRPELRELCEELGANYFRRDSNIHAKAGNLNHALEQTDGQFVIIFDADHIAERNFITRTLGYFCDDRLGYVQTPHSFYNFDCFQSTLNYEKKLYWEEGHLFYNVVQPGKNNWNAVSFCGSAAIFRREALEDVGLIATETITEDLQTGIRVHANGWKSIYVNERLVSGLAAPDIETFSKQRLRWGEGNLGTIFYDNPITKPGLTFAQRLNYLASMLNWTTGAQKLLMYATPILMLLTGIGPVADLTWFLIGVTIVYLLAVWFTVKNTGNGYVRLIDTEITQMATFWTQCQGTWRALFNRRNAKFVVTKKSGKVPGGGIHSFLLPHYILIGASALAICWAAVRYFVGVSEDVSGMLICTALVLANCCIAWVVIRRALTQRRMHWRHPVSAHVAYQAENADGSVIKGQGITKDLSEAGASMICYQPIEGNSVSLVISVADIVVPLDAEIRNRREILSRESARDGKVSAYRYGLLFPNPTTAQKRDLWAICTKYAVARHYHDFDPHTKKELIKDVSKPNDQKTLLPLRLSQSNSGESDSERNLVTESISAKGFVTLSPVEPQPDSDLTATIDSAFGEIKCDVELENAEPVDLGQLQLYAKRYKFKSFDGECRGRFASILNHPQNSPLAQAQTLMPAKTRTSIAWPASIAAGICAAAAIVTVLASSVIYPDDALITRAIVSKQVGDSGIARLRYLVKVCEANPMADESRFLRLRNAMESIGDNNSVLRLNQTLANHKFSTNSAKIQRAYALEKLDRVDEAAEQFDEVIADIDELSSEKSKTELLIGRARNAVNNGDQAHALELFKYVWNQKTHNQKIRSEFAGLLAPEHPELATKVLLAGRLSEDDRFLLSSIQIRLGNAEVAKTLLGPVVQDPTTENAQRAIKQLALIELWSKEYESATESLRELHVNNPEDIDIHGALVQSLSWGDRHREALDIGYEKPCVSQPGTKIPEFSPMSAMLESIIEVEHVTKTDRAWLLSVFSKFENINELPASENSDANSNWNLINTKLGSALERVLKPEQAGQKIAKLVELQPDSRELKLSLTRVLYSMGDYASAAKHYEQLLTPQWLPTDLRLRGEVYLSAALNSRLQGKLDQANRRYQLALECYCSLIKEDSDDSDLWKPFLDSVAGSNSHSDECRQYLESVFLQRNSFDSDQIMMIRLSDALDQINRPERALSVLSELESSLDSDVIWRKANLLVKLEKFEEAKTCFDELIHLDAFGDDLKTRIDLFLAAANNDSKTDDAETAKARFLQALELARPGVTDRRNNQGNQWTKYLSACAGLDEISSEDKVLVDYIFENREPLMEDAYFVERLVNVFEKQRQQDKTIPLFESLLQQNSKSRELRMRYVDALRANEKWSEANKQYKLLLKSENDETQKHKLYLGVAETTNELGQKSVSVSFANKALNELRPAIQFPKQSHSLWKPYLKALGFSGAVTLADEKIVNNIWKSVSDQSTDPDFAVALANALRMVDRRQAAADILSLAHKSNPDDQDVCLAYSRELAENGRYEEAKVSYIEVLKRSLKKDGVNNRGQLMVEVAQKAKEAGDQLWSKELFASAHKLLSESLESNNDSALWPAYLNAASGAPNVNELDRKLAISIASQSKTFEKNTDMLERLADLLAKTNEKRTAIRILRRIEQLGSRSTYADARIAILLAESGDPYSAESRIQQLLQESEETVDENLRLDLLLIGGKTARDLGQLTLSQKRYQDAITQLRVEAKDENCDLDTIKKYLSAVAGVSIVDNKQDIQLIKQLVANRSGHDLEKIGTVLPDALLKVGMAAEATSLVEPLIETTASAENLRRMVNIKDSLGKVDEALNVQRKLLRREDANNVDRFLYANNLIKVGEHELAQNELDKLVKFVLRSARQMTYASTAATTKIETPADSVNWLVTSAENLLELEKVQPATETLESAISMFRQKSAPNPDDMTFRIARVLDRLDKSRKAERHFERLVESGAFAGRPVRRAELWLAYASTGGRLGETGLMADRYQMALPLWRELYENELKQVKYWPWYLDAMGGTRTLDPADVENAIEIFSEFESTDLVSDVTFVNRLIDVMIRVERAEDSLRVAFDNFARFSNDPRARLRLANNLHALSRFVQADEHYDVLIDSESFSDDEQTRGQLLVTAARNSASLHDFEKSNRNFEILKTFGILTRNYEIEHAVILNKLGEHERAKRILDSESLTLDQKYRYASMNTSVSQHQEAHRMYEEIIGEIPDDEVAKRRDIQSMIWMGNHDQALEQINHVRKELPDDPALRLMEAQSFFRSENYANGLSLMKETMESDPENTYHQLAYLELIAALPVDYEFDTSLVDRLTDGILSGSEKWLSRRQRIVATARPLARIGKGEEAIQLLKKELSANENDPELNRELGEVMLLSQRYELAIKHLKLAFKSKRLKDQVRFRLAEAYLQNKHYAKSIELIGNSESRIGHQLLTSIYLEKKDYNEARSWLNKLLKRKPDSINYQIQFADSYLWQRNYSEAIRLYSNLQKRAPDNLAVKLKLSQAFNWSGNHAEAKSIAVGVLRQSPDQTEFWPPLMESLAGMDRVAMSDPLFIHIVKNYEKTLDEVEARKVAVRLSKIRLKADQVSLAMRSLRPFLENGKDDVELQMQYALVLSANDQWKEAETIIGSIVDRLDPTDPMMVQTKRTLADIYYRSGQHELALRNYQELIDLADTLLPHQRESISLALARVYVGLGEFDKAINLFNRVDELHPNSQLDKYELAGVYAQAGLHDQALDLLSPIEQLPIEARYLKASIYTSIGMYRPASQIYRSCIKLDPGNHQAWLGLADVSAWGKDYRTAVFAYQHLLRQNLNSVASDENPIQRTIVQSKLAKALHWSGKSREALDLTLELLEQNPENEDLLWALVEASSAVDSTDERVTTYLRRAHLLLRDSYGANQNGDRLLALAKAFGRNGGSDESVNLMRQLVAKSPNNRRLRRQFADLLHSLKRFDEADIHYRKLLNAETVKQRGRTGFTILTGSRSSR